MEIKDRITGIISNQINDINDELSVTKIKYADLCLKDEDWHIKVKFEKKCRILEGQIEVLERMAQNIEDIFVLAA
ncbi:MAG: hypothetical protein WCK67_11105 [bacterium]